MSSGVERALGGWIVNIAVIGKDGNGFGGRPSIQQLVSFSPPPIPTELRCFKSQRSDRKAIDHYHADRDDPGVLFNSIARPVATDRHRVSLALRVSNIDVGGGRGEFVFC